jgi:hypothetical protein
VDGDTGWELGVKWRLTHVDTPELTSPVRGKLLRKLVQHLLAHASAPCEVVSPVLKLLLDPMA